MRFGSKVQVEFIGNLIFLSERIWNIRDFSKIPLDLTNTHRDWWQIECSF